MLSDYLRILFCGHLKLMSQVSVTALANFVHLPTCQEYKCGTVWQSRPAPAHSPRTQSTGHSIGWQCVLSVISK